MLHRNSLRPPPRSKILGLRWSTLSFVRCSHLYATVARGYLSNHAEGNNWHRLLTILKNKQKNISFTEKTYNCILFYWLNDITRSDKESFYLDIGERVMHLTYFIFASVG